MTACRFWPEISPKTPPARLPFSTPVEWRWVLLPSTSPITRNLRKMAGRLFPPERGSGSTPYNFTWNTEIDQEIRPHVIARVSYLASKTYNEFTVNPEVLSPTSGLLLLSNLGESRYHEFEATLRVRPSDNVDFNISYRQQRRRAAI